MSSSMSSKSPHQSDSIGLFFCVSRWPVFARTEKVERRVQLVAELPFPDSRFVGFRIRLELVFQQGFPEVWEDIDEVLHSKKVAVFVVTNFPRRLKVKEAIKSELQQAIVISDISPSVIHILIRHLTWWSILRPCGTGTVFPKSINQTEAFLWSWTNSRELPINWKENKSSKSVPCSKHLRNFMVLS